MHSVYSTPPSDRLLSCPVLTHYIFLTVGKIILMIKHSIVYIRCSISPISMLSNKSRQKFYPVRNSVVPTYQPSRRDLADVTLWWSDGQTELNITYTLKQLFSKYSESKKWFNNNNNNVNKGINTWAVLLVRYSGLFFKFTWEELKQMDQRTWKLIIVHKALHPRDPVDRLYVSRKEEGRGLACNEDSVGASI